MHNDFLSKIKELLGDRDLYPWADSIGLGKGVANSIAKNTAPKADALAAISRAENVRIDWLLKNEGSPFSVIRARSDTECAETLESYFDESWTVYLVTDGANHAYVLTQPGQYQIKDRWVDYTIVEVITGPCGREAAMIPYRLGFHFERSTQPKLYLVRTGTDTMHDLIAGNLGTYKIALSDHHLLHQKNPITTEELVEFFTADEKDRVGDRVSEPPAPYHTLDTEVINALSDMSEDEKKTALRLIKALKSS